MLIDTCGMAATPFTYCAGFSGVRGGTERLLLIRGEKRADIFHSPLQPTFDVARDLLQLLVVLLQPRQPRSKLVAARPLVAQALVDHRLEPAERGVDAAHVAARLRLLHRQKISAAYGSGQHLAPVERSSPRHLGIDAQ